MRPDRAVVPLDVVIKAMWETAQDMHKKYWETAKGGLATSLPWVMPNC